MASSRTKASAANMLGNVVYQGTLVVSGFVLPQVIVRCYGSEINGLVASLTQFIGYFTLVEAGISGAAVYALYGPLSNSDWTRVSGIVSAARKFYWTSGYLFMGLVLALVFYYSVILDSGGLSVWSLVGLVLALGSKGVLEFFTLAKYRVLLTADQRAWIVSLASAGTNLLTVLLVVVLALMRTDVVVVYAFAAVPLFLRSLVLFQYTKVKYPQVDYSASPDTAALAQRWDALYLRVLGSVQLGAPVMLATVLLKDLRLVSVLSVYMMITMGIQLLIGVPANSLQAVFGDVITRGETETLRKAYREFEFLVHSLTAAVCGTAFVTIGSFVLIYTADFTDVRYAYPLLGTLAVLDVLLYHMKTPQGLMVLSAGLYRETRVQTTVQAMILVVGGVPLGLLWGLNGIVIATCLSDFYRIVDLLFFVPRHLTGLSVVEGARRILVTAVSVVTICAPFVFIRMSPSGYGQWITTTLLVALWSLMVVLVVGRMESPAQMRGLFGRIKGLVGVR